MSDRDALFRAILAAPDDDAPRLVFADWLDEHGDPDRAEFIRVQCRMARLPFYESGYPALQDRAARLFVRHMTEWRFPWLPPRQQCRRGFAADLWLPADVFVRHHKAIAAHVPAPTVHFTDVPGNRVWRWEYAARLVGIEFPGQPWDPAEEALGRGLELPLLKWLRVGMGPGSVQFLAGLGRPALEVLELETTMYGEFDPGSLFVVADLRTLRSFRFDVPDYTTYSDRLRAGGARAIADAGLDRLRRLSLAGQAVGDAGLSHLSRSPALADLEELYLDRNEIGAIGTTGIEDLCAGLHHLRVLSLSGNPLGVAGARELAAWPGLKQLRWLNLSGCGLTAEAARAFARSPYLHDRLIVVLDGTLEQCATAPPAFVS